MVGQMRLLLVVGESSVAYKGSNKSSVAYKLNKFYDGHEYSAVIGVAVATCFLACDHLISCS